MRGKIGIIGAGDIGLNLAEILALYSYNVNIYNRYHQKDGEPSEQWLSKQGFVMDLNDSLHIPGRGRVELTHDLDKLTKSDIIIITAGAKRTSPDETREQLACKNAKIMDQYIDLIASSSATILIISNPVDFLTQYIITQTATKHNLSLDQLSQRVFGVSCIDTMRLRNIVKEILAPRMPSINKCYVDGISLGEHGPSMVPLMSKVLVDGVKVAEIAKPEEIQEIAKQTILRGNDIIKLTGASSVTGPAHAALHMVNEIFRQDNSWITCSVWDGQRCIGRNVLFAHRKFKRIEETAMSDHESQMLTKSEQALDKQYDIIMNLLFQSDL